MYKAGQVLLIKFHPSSGNELKKYRPAIVVSDVAQNADKRFVLISPLSTRQPRKKNSLEIELTDVNFLREKSYTMLWYLRTLDTRRVKFVLGSLPPKTMKTIQKRLQKMFT